MNSELRLNNPFAFIFIDDLHKEIKGRGHILPLLIKFKTWPEEDGWIEPGMTAWIVDAIDSGDGFAIEIYFFFGDHEEENYKFFKREFKKNPESELYKTALETGHYNQRYKVQLPKDDKINKYFHFV